MVKKLLATIILTLGLVIGNQFATMPEASAGQINDTYVYSDQGVDYYMNYVTYESSMVGASLRVSLKGVSGGENVSNLQYDFLIFGSVSYTLYDGKHRGAIDSGDISQNPTAKLVYEIGMQNK